MSFVTMDSHQQLLAQIHQKGGPTGFMEGFKSNPGVLMFHAQEGYYDFDWLYLHGSRTDIKQTDLKFRLLSLDDMKGKWTDISFCLDFANNNMSLGLMARGNLILISLQQDFTCLNLSSLNMASIKVLLPNISKTTIEIHQHKLFIMTK